MRIAIVNDSAIAVEALRRVVTSVPHYSVAWLAYNGREAVDLAASDLPDAILMDLHMPEMDGIQAVRAIMAATPCPILVVTATVQGHAAEVFEALAGGALDAVRTPVLSGPEHEASRAHFLAKLNTIERLVGKKRVVEKPAQAIPQRPAFEAIDTSKLVLIGASAGGPGAVAEILRDLPALFPPVVIVQHIDAQFAAGMADWLNGQTKLSVAIARPHDNLLHGHAYIAGLDGHLYLSKANDFIYDKEPLCSVYMPCIDVFFNSVAQHWKGRVVAALLTGMGRDGAVGLKTLRDGGAHTIAQDRESSVVYGMPKAAAEIDAAAEILPLNCIANALIKFAGKQTANG